MFKISLRATFIEKPRLRQSGYVTRIVQADLTHFIDCNQRCVLGCLKWRTSFYQDLSNIKQVQTTFSAYSNQAKDKKTSQNNIKELKLVPLCTTHLFYISMVRLQHIGPHVASKNFISKCLRHNILRGIFNVLWTLTVYFKHSVPLILHVYFKL